MYQAKLFISINTLVEEDIKLPAGYPIVDEKGKPIGEYLRHEITEHTQTNMHLAKNANFKSFPLSTSSAGIMIEITVLYEDIVDHIQEVCIDNDITQ